MAKKIGLKKLEKGDEELINKFLDILENQQLDFTNALRSLSEALTNSRKLIENAEYNNWQKNWKKRISQQNESVESTVARMNKVNPIFIPRNHIIEEIIEQAYQTQSFEKMFEFIEVLKKPFQTQQNRQYYQQPATSEKRVKNTFCGT